MTFYGSGSVSVPKGRFRFGFGSKRSVPVRFSVPFFWNRRTLPATGEFGAAAGPLGPATDNTDWNKQVNIFKIRLKLLSMLYEYQNNLDGADAISFNTIKIVNGDGKLINVKR
jgi:hypothetical protein